MSSTIGRVTSSSKVWDLPKVSETQNSMKGITTGSSKNDKIVQPILDAIEKYTKQIYEASDSSAFTKIVTPIKMFASTVSTQVNTLSKEERETLSEQVSKKISSAVTFLTTKGDENSNSLINSLRALEKNCKLFEIKECKISTCDDKELKVPPELVSRIGLFQELKEAFPEDDYDVQRAEAITEKKFTASA